MTTQDDNHILNASDMSYRQAGRDMGGKIIKGFVQGPTIKTSVSSIQYKFETIIYRNDNPKGFGTTAQRFLIQNDQATGPWSYIGPQYLNILTESNSHSYSVKGYGNGFISKTSRKLYDGPIKGGLGPGAYDIKDRPFQIVKLDSITTSFILRKTESISSKYGKQTPGQDTMIQS